MSIQTIRVAVPVPGAAPRGARWAAAFVVWLTRLGRRGGQRFSALVDPAARAEPGTYRRLTPTLLAVIGRSIWRALEHEGQRRGARELQAAAARYQHFDPALAAQLREASRFNPID